MSNVDRFEEEMYGPDYVPSPLAEVVKVRKVIEQLVETYSTSRALPVKRTTDEAAPSSSSQPPLPPLRDNTACVLMTPELAQDILKHGAFIASGKLRQRKVVSARVEYLFDTIVKDEWSPGSSIEIVVLPNGDIYLNNGQHRLLALIKAKRSLWLRLSLIYVQTMDQAERHWLATDRGCTARTVSAAISLRIDDLLASEAITEGEVELLSRAIRVLNGGFEHRTTNGDTVNPQDTDMAAAIRYFLEPAKECFKLMRKAQEKHGKGKKQRHLMTNVFSAPVLGMMLVTQSEHDAKTGLRKYDYKPKIAKFWEDIALKTALPDTNASIALEFLNDPSTTMSDIGSANIAYVMSYFYNAEVTGKLCINSKQPIKKPKPVPHILLLGTEFKDRVKKRRYFYEERFIRDVKPDDKKGPELSKATKATKAAS